MLKTLELLVNNQMYNQIEGSNKKMLHKTS